MQELQTALHTIFILPPDKEGAIHKHHVNHLHFFILPWVQKNNAYLFNLNLMQSECIIIHLLNVFLSLIK